MTAATAIKSKAYDVDKRRAITLSALETALSDKIFGRIENILSRNNYEVRGKYVSYGKCECFTKAHRQTRFIIELNSKEIGVEVIHDIEDDLDSLDVEFANRNQDLGNTIFGCWC